MKRDVETDETDSTKRIKTSKSSIVGLTQFICSGFTPIKGLFKSRFEDFLVTEIDISGSTCEVTPFTVPELPEVKKKVGDVVELSEEVRDGLNKVIGKEVDHYLMPCSDDKIERTNLHKTISQFSGSLSSETVKEGDSNLIKVALKRRSAKGNRDHPRSKDAQYTHFTLVKWNITINEVITRLSGILNIKPKNFSYGGMKDKRAITTQRVCCRFMAPKRLAGLNRPFLASNSDPAKPLVYHNNFILGNFSYDKDDIKLGAIQGNQFTVLLRDCAETTQANLDNITTQVSQSGFINYFGLQRFGNACDTHIVGRMILLRDYKGAVNTILRPNANHKPEVKEALQKYQDTGDAGAAHGLLTKRYERSIEGLVLEVLKDNAKNYKGALKTLHFKQQTLYAHAYQSYVWNRAVSERIAHHGCRTLVGDLAGDGDGFWVIGSEEEARKTPFTEVVFPLPGYDVTLPNNVSRDYLTQLLLEDGMSLESFKGATGKEFNVSGCYRRALYKPTNFTATRTRYSEENQKLVSSVLDRVCEKEFRVGDEGDKLAIKLEFQLPKSCYATMLLREISRIDED